MYLLALYQEGMEAEIGLFHTVEEGRRFLSQWEAYRSEVRDGWLYEWIAVDEVPDYLELEHNGHRVPLTKWMFVGEGQVEVVWKALPDLSVKGQGLVPGATRVDAYSIDNEDLEGYIASRESRYRIVKEHLAKKGLEVTRAYFGSEDGEGILYRKENAANWRFLGHLDPAFCEGAEIEELLAEIDEEIGAAL